MSYYERQAQSSAPRRSRGPKVARDWSSKPLSSAQKRTLVLAAKAAFAIQRDAGLVDGPEDEFRHTQVAIACGKSGLRECGNADFRSILAHFQHLAGKESAAKSTWSQTGRVPGSDEVGDTHENRETARAILRDLAALSCGAISDDYVSAIAADRFQGRAVADLRASELQDLVFVVQQRLRRKQP